VSGPAGARLERRNDAGEAREWIVPGTVRTDSEQPKRELGCHEEREPGEEAAEHETEMGEHTSGHRIISAKTVRTRQYVVPCPLTAAP